jgi:hypothetical protein
MSSKTNFCNDIAIIPQFEATCWFNAILMSCFYSQGMRNLMINKVSKNWDNSSLFKLFKTIIKTNYNTDAKDKLENLYHKIKPELILLKTLIKFNPELFYFFKIKQNTEFRWNINYIINFLGFLKVNYLDIIYYEDQEDDEDIILFNFSKYYKPQFITNRHTGQLVDIITNFTIDDNPDFTKEKQNIKKIINEIPDVLIIRHDHFIKDIDFNEIYTNLTQKFKDANVHKSDNYDIPQISINDIKHFKDVIHIFDQEYELDNVILGNYNINSNTGHIILGMHCNNYKYVYNGWNNPITNKPCPLYKFNWDLHHNKHFTLNTNDCKLDFDLKIKNTEKYSFNNGSAVLIYVRKNDHITSNELTISSKTNSLSHINDILKEYYDLNDLNLDKIKVILKKLFIPFNDTDDYDILEEKLFNKLELFYNYKTLTKTKLINEIHKINPGLTDLHLKTKIELEHLFNRLIENSVGLKRSNSSSIKRDKKLKKYT